jgi:uncharacterized damage-inducible protein DinB
METTLNGTQTGTVITSAQLLEHWQGHRKLTRKLIERFPEKELFSYSIGGMRTFADIVKELLAIAGPGLKEIALGQTEKLNEENDAANTKEAILKLWDEATEQIDFYWAQIPDSRFSEKILAFGQYEGTVLSTIFYFLDNEIHHRGQGYVYLRSLGIEPPFFWER